MNPQRPSAQPAMHQPPQTAADEPLDLIFIDGFVCDTVIGIHDSELHKPQPLVIDVCAGIRRARACDTDHIGDTLDYSELRLRLVRLLAEHQVKLLEALAEQIADITLNEFGASWVRVRVAKPRKFDDLQAVGVMIERRRQATPAAPPRNVAVLQLIGAGMVPGGR